MKNGQWALAESFFCSVSEGKHRFNKCKWKGRPKQSTLDLHGLKLQILGVTRYSSSGGRHGHGSENHR